MLLVAFGAEVHALLQQSLFCRHCEPGPEHDPPELPLLPLVVETVTVTHADSHEVKTHCS
jgi:hypothetical protein